MATKHQTFTVRQIARELIKNAAYNPRIISDDARRMLKKKIKKTGLIEPLIWNAITGNLVGGHQRLSILDELEGRDDYELTVSEVTLSEAEEKKMNVFLNNTAAMGEWDEEKLAGIVKEFADSPQELGFDLATLEVIFEDGELGGLFDDKNETATADIDTIREMKEQRKDHKEQSDETESGDHYAVLVFPSKEVRDEFLIWSGQKPGERFTQGEAFKQSLARLIAPDE